jgi:hypothetical protein
LLAALIGVGVIVAIAIVVVALLASSGDGSDAAPKRRRPSPSALANKQYGKQFVALMATRDQFFTLERNVLAPLAQADGQASAYQAAEKKYEDDVDRVQSDNAAGFANCQQFLVRCPDPVYPDPPATPDFGPQVLLLRRAAADLRALSAQLSASAEPARLGTMSTQFKSAVDALASQADQDADVLAKAADPANESFDPQEFATLKRDLALPAIQQMNVETLDLINLLGRDIKTFDVPGGHDIDPSDSSTAVPQGFTTTTSTPAATTGRA